MDDLTIADHMIIKLKSRYSWFGNIIAKMDLSTKKELREEWGNVLNTYGDASMQYALQQDNNKSIFEKKMEPYEALKKLKALFDEQQNGFAADSMHSSARLAQYNSEYDDLIKNAFEKGFSTLSDEEWEVYRKERIRLSALIANEEVKLRRSS